MKQQIIWKILFIFTSCIVFTLGGLFVWKFIPYFQYSSFTRGEMLSWEVIEQEPSIFGICVKYRYPTGDQFFEGEYIFKQPRFTNEHVAKETIQFMEKEKWEIWYKKRRPELSTLQRLFPFKAMIRFLLSVGILGYFFWFKEYLRRFSS